MIEPKGKYLKNEVTQLFEFYNTVDRYSGTQLFGIANLMSAYNPYFEYFGITPFREEFRWYKDKTLLVQNVKIKGMDDYVRGQRFYKLVEGTDYAEYLTNNTPWQDDKAFIQKKPKDAMLVCNIRMYGKLFGVWTSGDCFYVSSKNNPEELTYAGAKSMQDGDEPIIKGITIHKMLTRSAEFNKIRYDTIPIRDMCYSIMNGGFING